MATGPKEHYMKGFFRHGSNSLLVAGLAGAAAYLVTGGRRPHLRATVAGVGVFMVAEYLNHRFAFHSQPVAQPFIRKLQRRLHYDHHRRPNDLTLLFLPPWYLVPSVVMYFAGINLVVRSMETTTSVMSGAMLALLYYEYVHYVAHIPVTPSTPWGKWMKKYHLLHHYKNEHYWFGVTSPTFDYVFATYRDVAAVEKSGTTHALEGDYVEPDRH